MYLNMANNLHIRKAILYSECIAYSFNGIHISKSSMLVGDLNSISGGFTLHCLSSIME
jgi:hypothetical protein